MLTHDLLTQGLTNGSAIALLTQGLLIELVRVGGKPLAIISRSPQAIAIVFL